MALRYGGASLMVLLGLSVPMLAEVPAGEARLIEAVKAGDAAAVHSMLKGPTDVNAPDDAGATALHWAVLGDQLDMAQQLLEAGADPKAKNRYGVQPISLAATNGNAAMLDTLLKAGADPNAALPSGGETVLMTAARTGNPQALAVLIAHGANVNAADNRFGETALMWAAAEDHADAVKMLIDAGAAMNAQSAATTFTRRGGMPRGRWTALMYAARQGSLAAAKSLTDAGADLNLTDPDGTTALTLAIINAHYDLAALLLEKNADPNIADATGMTALYAAVDMNTVPWTHGRPSPKASGDLTSLDVIKRLLARGANPNAALKSPALPRHQRANDPGMSEGTTVLMRAAKTGDVPVMLLLLEHGADPYSEQKNGTTLLMIAAGMGWRGGHDTSRDGGTEEGAIEAITLCLQRGADIKAVNDLGQTALHGAIGRGESVIRFLVAQGVDVHARDKQGKTALDLAIAARDYDINTDHVGPEIRRRAVTVLEELTQPRP